MVSSYRSIPNKTENLKLRVFNVITRINESKTLTKHIPCEFKHKFDDRNFKSNQSRTTINVDVRVKICKNLVFAKNIIFGILLHAVVKIIII